MLSPQQIEELPFYVRREIPESFLDDMGHMNVQHYVGLFSDAAGALFRSCGMDKDCIGRRRRGVFVLRQCIDYLAEVRVGHTVAVRTRVLERGVRKLHLMHFMVNESLNRIAACMDVLAIHADLERRRSTEWDEEMARGLDRLILRSRELSWEPPLSGVIRLGKSPDSAQGE